MKLNFTLRGDVIYIDLRINSERIRYSTEERAEVKKWDTKLQRSKKDKALNEFLDDLEYKIKGINRRLIIDGQLSKSSLTKELDVLFGKRQENYSLKEWLTIIKGRKIANPTLSKDYVSSWNMTIDQISLFGDVDLSKLSKLYLEDLRAFVYKNGYSINSAKLMYTLIKHALNVAVEDEVISYNPKKFRLKFPKYELIQPYNTSEELQAIENVLLPPDLDFVRDRYLIGCETGLRVNKWLHIGPEYIQGDILIVTDKKTIHNKKIPLNDRLSRLLEGISDKQEKAKKITSKSDTAYYQNVLKGIPKVCKAAGIDQPFVRQERNKEGDLVDVTYEKYELIKTHTARRTFACIKHYEEKWPLREIMKITGHENIQSIQRYLMASA